jgi:TP901 family phage tail tape measure protein
VADRIKGITIEIGGDTTGLNKALSGVNKEISSTQGQLKDVERLLKLDPTNTELLRQKQKLLAEAVQGTKGKLDTLKEANKQVTESASNYDAWKEKYDPIKKQIDETKKKLGDLKEQSRNADEQLANGEISQEKYDALQEEIKKTSSELKTLQKSAKEVSDEFGNPVAPEQYDALQREIAETEQQLKSLEDQAGKANTTLQQISAAGDKFQEVGQKIEGAGKKLLPVTAAVAGVGAAAVKTTADFDESMSNVSAISGATGEEFDQLRDKAREMGAETKFSASEAADAMSYMAMAGWKTDDMLNGISGIMNLAAASGADLATTSDIVTDALTGMGYTAADAGRLADVMAAASSNANTNVEMMGETFKYVAPVCGSLGYSMEDTALAVGLMANSGIKASQAGTQLRAAITNMVKPTEAMEGVMMELGIEIANEDGSMKSLDETLKILRESFAVTTEEQKAQRLATLEQQAVADGYGDTLKGLSEEEKYFQLAMYAGQEQIKDMSEAQFKKQAMDKLGIKVTKKTNKAQVAQNLALALGTQAIEGLTQEQQSAAAATLFGKEAMSGMLAIINASEDDYKKLSDAIANSEGAAEDMAETMQDNLNGQLTILKSQLQEAAIAIGDALIPKIRALVAKIQQWTDWFNRLEDSQKQTVITVGLIVAAIGPLLIAIGKVSTGIGAVMSAVTALGPMLAGLSAAGGPIMLTAAALGAIAYAAYDAKKRTNEYYNKAVELTDQEQHHKEMIDELYSSYELMNQSRVDAVNSVEAEAAKEQELFSELQKVTDENGNVKAGYEERAKYILGELSTALGQEYELTGNQIQNYKDMCDSIDDLILKKQANALMDANAEAYAEALKNRTDAFMKYNDAQKDVEETTKKLEESQRREALLQEDLNALRESGIVHMLGLSNESAYLAEKVKEASETTKGYEAKLSELDQTLLDAETAYVGYKTVMSNQDMLIAAKDNQELLADAVLMASNSFQTAESSTKASLERQLQDFTDKYQAMRAAVEAGAPGVVQADVDQMKVLVDRSKEELDRLPDVIRETVGKNALAAAAESNDGYRSAGGEYARKLAEGIDGGKGEVADAMTDVANKTQSIMEGLTPLAETWSGDMMKGFVAGIKSKTSEIAEVCRSVAGTVSDYLHFTRPEKGPLRYYEEWMPHMMQGLEEGIRGNMWRVTDQMAALAGSMDVMTMDMSGGGEQNGSVTQQVISLLETYLPDIASQKYVMMDGKALVGKTAGQMDRKLGQVQALKERIG